MPVASVAVPLQADVADAGVEMAQTGASGQDLYQTDEFRMFCFKILPCSKRCAHDWTTCPFAHPGEKARRRDPRTHPYLAIPCPEVKANQPCPRGDACQYSHSVFEFWAHPARYRTQLCQNGTACRRSVCFFAHTLAELRVPGASHLKHPGGAVPGSIEDCEMAVAAAPGASPASSPGIAINQAEAANAALTPALDSEVPAPLLFGGLPTQQAPQPAEAAAAAAAAVQAAYSYGAMMGAASGPGEPFVAAAAAAAAALAIEATRGGAPTRTASLASAGSLAPAMTVQLGDMSMTPPMSPTSMGGLNRTSMGGPCTSPTSSGNSSATAGLAVLTRSWTPGSPPLPQRAPQAAAPMRRRHSAHTPRSLPQAPLAQPHLAFAPGTCTSAPMCMAGPQSSFSPWPGALPMPAFAAGGLAGGGMPPQLPQAAASPAQAALLAAYQALAAPAGEVPERTSSLAAQVLAGMIANKQQQQQQLLVADAQAMLAACNAQKVANNQALLGLVNALLQQVQAPQ